MHNRRRLHRWLLSMLLSMSFWQAQALQLFAEDAKQAPVGKQAAGAPDASSAQGMPKEIDGVGITQNLDAQIPLDLEFIDSDGKKIALGQLFDGRLPAILTMNYSDCPMLCSLQLNGLIDAIKPMTWKLGEDYQIITVSIDPLEPPERAQLTKQKYLEMYGRTGCAAGWRFLTTQKNERIKKLADCIGFGYKYLPDQRRYAHPALLTICTPDGRVSRYFSGIKYNPRDLRLALYEAGEGKVGSAVDQVLLICFHYDPLTGTYSWAAFRIVQIGGVLTVVVLGGALSMFWLREWRKRRMRDEGSEIRDER
jgi:protein SCO1/2